LEIKKTLPAQPARVEIVQVQDIGVVRNKGQDLAAARMGKVLIASVEIPGKSWEGNCLKEGEQAYCPAPSTDPHRDVPKAPDPACPQGRMPSIRDRKDILLRETNAAT
jgi:hypothetical protein